MMFLWLLKKKTGMAPFNALDKVVDQMSLSIDFNRQLKHCVGSSGNLFPCYTCEDCLNFIEVVLPCGLCMKGIKWKEEHDGVRLSLSLPLTSSFIRHQTDSIPSFVHVYFQRSNTIQY